MSYFDWNENYSVGVAELDRQHKKLISLLNELFDGMKAGSARQVLGSILSSLVDYTEKHFAAEELIMENHAYPELWRHRKEHTDLTQKVHDFQRKFDNGEITVSLELSSFLKDWLANHILKTDKRYTEFLNNKGVR